MRVVPTAIPGVLIIEPDVHQDGRGFFLETYHAERYREHGIAGPFVQDNHSRSVAGTLRGLHLQLRHPQGKLIRVIEGEIFDVAVDVRRGSPTFGRWVGVSADARRTSSRSTCRPASRTASASSARSRRSNTSAPTSTTRRARSASPGTIRRSASRGRSASRCCPRAMQRHPSLATLTDKLPDLFDRSVRSATKLVGPARTAQLGFADFTKKPAGMALASERDRFAGLITAGRRECWGSQTSGAEGHRNDAMPFCLY